MKSGAVRRELSIISQDTVIFPMSVLDNIRIGRPEAGPDEIKKAAGEAGCGIKQRTYDKTGAENQQRIFAEAFPLVCQDSFAKGQHKNDQQIPEDRNEGSLFRVESLFFGGRGKKTPADGGRQQMKETERGKVYACPDQSMQSVIGHPCYAGFSQ